MNPEAKKELDRILDKNKSELNEEEIGFLRARRDYLKEAQLKEYQDLIDVRDEELSQTSEKSEPAKQNAKKSK